MHTALRMAIPFVLILSLDACVSARIEESRKASTEMSIDETLVILGRASYNRPRCCGGW